MSEKPEDESSVPVVATGVKGFQKGADPRRWRGGKMSADVAAFKAALEERLDIALAIVDEALSSSSAKRRDAMAIEVMDRTLGKPKAIDVDSEGIVRAQLADIFGRVREKLDPHAYRALVTAMAEAESKRNGD